VQLYERAAVKKIARAARIVQSEVKAGKSKQDAIDACLIDLVKASEVGSTLQCSCQPENSPPTPHRIPFARHNKQAHSYLYTITAFLQQVRAVSSGPVQAVLKKLFLLFALNRVANDASMHLGDGWMNEEQLELLQDKVKELLRELRRDAVPLVDSFNIPDSLVNSPLGRYDGDLYPHYFETVRAAPGAQGKVRALFHLFHVILL